MFEYRIVLPYRIENCSHCPFRNEQYTNENILSDDKISGILSITKRLSFCPLQQNKMLIRSEPVEAFASTCPLKNNLKVVADEK